MVNNIIATFQDSLKKLNDDMSEMKAYGATVIKIGAKRQLTSGEIRMSQLVFKNSIDYSKVWIHVGGLIHTATGNAMTPAGEIYMSSKDYVENQDFSLSRPNIKHWFIHEMTHVWQYQNGAKTGWLGLKQMCSGGYTTEVQSVDSSSELKAYDTDLLGRDINKKFQDFNFEQQGRIIEFYFDSNFLKNDEPHRKHLQISLKLHSRVLAILSDFIKNPKNFSLLPN